ncbi:pilus assembly protein [Lederbergia sp. NSJ-179]|uniref:TadE/TadG family type IV pilus assembly protein n=1 Tax=Lederbergia sp. NSJ-179 TaxID=2931402 RepID=UPI001FD1D67F|nr:TadE/TadG family type IV pilus assembly protein [Lederbergia sp. NSJ-179]MCJ7840232.1 pilus assembly protein [Lederbergia sp. NSJ-179]
MKMQRFAKKEDGSLTLEAAMVMPFFLLFIVFLATIIRISVVDMALRTAVNDTTEMIATHVYPVTLLENTARSALDEKVKTYTKDTVNLDQVTDLASRLLSEFGINIMDHVNAVAGTALTPMVRSNFDKSMEDGFFDKDRLTVEVDAPSSFRPGAYIGVTATYEVGITAPFVNKKIKLRKKAYERLWSGA